MRKFLSLLAVLVILFSTAFSQLFPATPKATQFKNLPISNLSGCILNGTCPILIHNDFGFLSNSQQNIII